MKTLSDIEIQKINADRTAKTTDRYLDSAGNVWVGSTNGRLFIPPIADDIPEGEDSTVQTSIDVIRTDIASIPRINVKSFDKVVASVPSWTGSFTVIDSAITAASKVNIWQARAKLLNKGTLADENDMDSLIVSATCSDGQMIVHWQTQPIVGIRNGLPYRIGRVKGAFKFNYFIS